METVEGAGKLMKEHRKKAYYDLEKGEEVRKAGPRFVGALFTPDTPGEVIAEAMRKLASEWAAEKARSR
jgi:hypothetical protein